MNEAHTPAPSAVVTIGKASFGNDLLLALLVGPCTLESRAPAFETSGGAPSEFRLWRGEGTVIDKGSEAAYPDLNQQPSRAAEQS